MVVIEMMKLLYPFHYSSAQVYIHIPCLFTFTTSIRKTIVVSPEIKELGARQIRIKMVHSALTKKIIAHAIYHTS